MSLSRWWMGVAFALFLGGCAPIDPRDESLYYNYVPVGSTLELTRELMVPADRTRVWIQGGQPTPGLDHYDVSCNFEVRTIRDFARPIHPGVFRVTRVRLQPFVWVVSRPAPVQVAALDLAGMAPFDSDAADIAPTVHMYVSSAEQPDVMRLSCRGPMDHPSRARTPSIAEIREALGDWVLLALPPGSTGP